MMKDCNMGTVFMDEMARKMRTLIIEATSSSSFVTDVAVNTNERNKIL